MELLDLKTNEIIDNAIQRLSNYSSITFLSPGSKARMLLDILSEEIGLQANQFNLNVTAGFLRSAYGVMLDYIGEIFGVERLQETRAEVSSFEENFVLYTAMGNFGQINNGEDIVIEAGEIRISNEEDTTARSKIYLNTERIVLKANEERVFFSAQSITNGSSSNTGANSMLYHDFTNYQDSLNRSLFVNNTYSISYGRGKEDDDNYRYRIQKEKISSESANETAIRLALLVLPGVSDVTPIPYARGIGTCDWLISASSIVAAEEMLILAQKVIKEKEAIGMRNIARLPVFIGTEFIFSIKYKSNLQDREREAIKTNIRNGISSYVNNLQTGETLVLDQIVRIVLSSSSMIESMGDTDSSDNFRNVFLYKRSAFSGGLTRKTLTQNYVPKSYERVIMESGIAKPITIIENN